MNKPMYHISGSGVISLVLNGQPHNIQTDFATYALVRSAINNKDWAALPALLDVKTGVATLSGGRLEIVDDAIVKYDGQPMHNAMSDRLLALVSGGYPLDSFFKFVENVMLNPRETAVKELHLFLDKSGIPITEDGHFLAYRRVRSDYYSIHANPDGTRNRNMIGDECEMPSNMVDEDRNNTCSRGLHACSLSYLPNYGSDSVGDKTMIVKIHPKDVITIPSDYGNAKMRVSKYRVVAEHRLGEKTSGFNGPVYSSDGSAIGQTNQERASAVSQVTEIVDSFLRAVNPSVSINHRESFSYHGIQPHQLNDLIWEIEEEFDLEVQDLDYVSVHSPIRVLICFYENVLLKAGRDIK